MNKASKSQVSDTVASAVAASRGTPARMDPYFKQKVKGPPFKPCEEMKYEGVRLTTFKDWPRWGSVWPTLLARAGFFYTKTADQVACFCCGGRLKTWEAGDSPMTEHKRFFPRCRFVTGQDFTNIPLGEAPMVPSGGHGGCTSAKTDYYSRLAKQAAAGRSQANGPSSLNHLTQATMRPHKSLSMTTGGTTGMHSLTVTQIREMTLESKRLESFNNWPTADNLAQASCYYTGDDFPNVQSLMEAVFAAEVALPSSSSSRTKHERSVTNISSISESATAAAAAPTSADEIQTTASTSTGSSGESAPENQATASSANTKGSNGTSGTKATVSATEPSVSHEMKPEAKVTTSDNRLQCKICMDDEAQILFLPCGHLCSCAKCAPALRNCPICRALIRGTVRVYLP
ncbi:hypothetical protein NP493_511g00010 [Ridgeia piscesae]|uniref:RING-type domain-containing protein n=1 Tax=Ridgeia piscesae TaxID=27915 RepID=A0AAD9KX14_RIDPI|nr:hypothetical protein NP493_511g00010 [Ridgeia piscesae]